MTNNDILRSLRYTLNVSDGKLAQILALSGLEVSKPEMTSFLKSEEEDGFQECPDNILVHFLNGLVVYKRGKDDSRPPQTIESSVSHNLVLKKLRVAFKLKDTDIIEVIQKSGLRITKAELGAFFRNSDHRNYRPCGDQFLRYLLKGLAA